MESQCGEKFKGMCLRYRSISKHLQYCVLKYLPENRLSANRSRRLLLPTPMVGERSDHSVVQYTVLMCANSQQNIVYKCKSPDHMITLINDITGFEVTQLPHIYPKCEH